MSDEQDFEELTVPVGKHDHIQGPEDAPVTLVEYGDYECPYCGQAYKIIKQVQETMGDQMRFVFRNFPLREIHPNAENAAEAAETAAAQGKFWEMHDHLYEHSRALEDDDLFDYAGKVGLDADRFDQEMREHAHRDRVQKDFMSGVRSGVNGTPTFFINGVRYDQSWDADTLTEALQDAARG